MIEVLISILIFSFGILGAVGMQARVLQSSTQNSDRSRASMLANELASQMWLQQKVDVTDPNLSPFYTAWQTRVLTASVLGLPNATGTSTTSVIAGTTTNMATITITWRPTTMSSTSIKNKFVTSVVIP